ncbi:hypothetical protein P175DRAFT_0519743 [Aspergillus ochraceoroseus IBT 24754]|uniref:Nucleoside phosphorylase domain-containing protein n=2 Tax=Aspergillus ochraceoroseus TaxID=138278 RepID=A0A2T5M5A1_9EURO|nr:uncharacterized protein P175DRAFT_0519743 [Aspergillus ochraceoroseus IBT 24754]PTU23705.1 hypothetical protein P175DRAFT_0519743 [Aspergillus ochraceoroseus IBT 24754]
MNQPLMGVDALVLESNKRKIAVDVQHMKANLTPLQIDIAFLEDICRFGRSSDNQTTIGSNEAGLDNASSLPLPLDASSQTSYEKSRKIHCPRVYRFLEGGPSERNCEADETESVSSETSQLFDFDDISRVSKALFYRIHAVLLDNETINRLSLIMPDLLKALSLKLGYKAPTPLHYEVMVFLHKYREDIFKIFKDTYQNEQFHDAHEEKKDKSNKIRREELVENWLQILENIAPRPDTGAPSQQISDYCDTILRSPAYRWFLERVGKEIVLPVSKPDCMGRIRTKIIEAFPKLRLVSRHKPSEEYKATFDINWDPLQFFREREYKETIDEVLEAAITLTGSLDHAQALPCSSYMRQTWPLTGQDILDLVKKVTGNQDTYSTQLCDGTILAATTRGNRFQIEVQGTAWAIAEIGEQFAWLGASLRSSYNPKSLIICTPTVSCCHKEATSEGPISFQFEFQLDVQRESFPPSPGGCWHGIFSSPVIVRGYPILRRSESNTGLEVPLNIMAALGKAPRVTVWDGKVFLKGFHSVMIPTKVTADMVIWHLIFKPDGSYMSYTDSQINNMEGLYPERLSMPLLEKSRHALGWCSDATSYIGSSKAKYTIEWSGLLGPSAGGDFENVVIMRGKLLQRGPAAVYGNQDKSPYFGSDDYLDKLKWISRKFVVLYDVRDRRSWLVDGASALLHLLRASLNHDVTDDDFRDRLLFKWDQLQEVQGSCNSAKSAALAFLKHDINKNIRLYSKTDGQASRAISKKEQEFVRLKDRVEDLFHLMEQVIAHQESISAEKEMGLRVKTIDTLEGFDFMDMATNEDLFSPHRVDIQLECRALIDFTCSIHAITLFGDGFGEIIQPTYPQNVCQAWATVPKGLDFLAVCVSDIQEILKKKGSSKTRPWRIVNKLIWHTPEKTFEACQCQGSLASSICERVQVLLPESCLEDQDNAFRSPNELLEHGAVIFGQRSKSMLPRINFTNTVLRQSSSETTHSPSIDSGIGQSQSSPSSTITDHQQISTKRLRNHDEDLQDRKRPCLHPNTPGHIAGLVNVRSNPQPNPKTNTLPEENHWRRTIILNSLSMVMPYSKPSGREYSVGWLCAIKTEFDLALKMLDTTYDRGYGHGSDHNLYTLGRIGIHNVVVTCLPMGRYGNNAAAVAATRMMSKFPNIKIGLMVGIGGGIPNAQNDIRLGDIVVSKPEKYHGGVIQYDMGKFTAKGFEPVGYLNPPPEILLNALNVMPSHGMPLEHHQPSEVPVPYPGEELDRFYNSGYSHESIDGSDACQNCRDDELILRSPGNRERTGPHVFYGTIASGNSVIKDASVRDKLLQKNNFLCFEMESAGLMNSSFPCVVIRGISDYADSHKNNQWQAYAAATAAIYARNFLLEALASLYPEY